MGVDLGDLLRKKSIEISDLSGRWVAVDAFNTLYQFLSIIRQRDGTPLMDSSGKVSLRVALPHHQPDGGWRKSGFCL
jgi:flap endonuclease-1